MEIAGIVLLIGMFGLGLGAVYVFLQYVDLLKAVKATNEEIMARLNRLEQALEARGQKVPGTEKKSG
jgi:hypothetical protein